MLPHRLGGRNWLIGSNLPESLFFLFLGWWIVIHHPCNAVHSILSHRDDRGYGSQVKVVRRRAIILFV